MKDIMRLTEAHDLYSDYLIINQGQATMTDLSKLLEEKYSHDKFTRSLSEKTLSSASLWQIMKPHVKAINNSSGILILDDTVEEKPYMSENNLIRWHYDHVNGRSVKGINQLTALYHNEGMSFPICYKMIEKTLQVHDAKKNKDKWVSAVSKQEHFRNLVSQSIANGLIIKYILSDKWFSCVTNFEHIHMLGQHFIMPLKNNRMIALSKEAQQKGEYQPIGELVIEENQTLQIWLEKMDFPLLLTKQVFKNEETEGLLYLVTNDLMADTQEIKIQYQKRWNVETFYKSVKSNLGYANSPTHTVTTQTNHLVLAMVAFVKLELLKTSTKQNHFAMKRLLGINANKQAWKILQIWKKENTLLNKCA